MGMHSDEKKAAVVFKLLQLLYKSAIFTKTRKGRFISYNIPNLY